MISLVLRDIAVSLWAGYTHASSRITREGCKRRRENNLGCLTRNLIYIEFEYTKNRAWLWNEKKMESRREKYIIKLERDKLFLPIRKRKRKSLWNQKEKEEEERKKEKKNEKRGSKMEWRIRVQEKHDDDGRLVDRERGCLDNYLRCWVIIPSSPRHRRRRLWINLGCPIRAIKKSAGLDDYAIPWKGIDWRPLSLSPSLPARLDERLQVLVVSPSL